MPRVEESLDFRQPDYVPVFAERARRLGQIRRDPGLLAACHVHYKAHPVDLISDWGVTADPRVASRGMPVVMPFVLFPKQKEWLQFAHQNWLDNEPSITVKSRDVGASWLAMALSCVLCLYYDDLSIGFGSAIAKKVDNGEDPDSLFYKGRKFLTYLPKEFRGGWEQSKHSFENKIMFPKTRASITGEAGDKIGRGGRKALYFIDEAAHLERPLVVEGGLQGTTDCRHDISSVWGTNNPFYEKFVGGKIRTFVFTWRDDPRKDQDWYDKKKEQTNPIIFNQEVDCDWQASVEGILIPSEHVSAAIDLHKKLGIEMTGEHTGALDIADLGEDKNAFSIRQGNLVKHAESWHGTVDLDIAHSGERAFLLCDRHKLTAFTYDADGMGANFRGIARKINERRKSEGLKVIQINTFRGSGEVLDPERSMIEGRKNKDAFENFKAMSWWSLSLRFMESFRAASGKPYDPKGIISIASDFPERARLCLELSQPIWGLSKSGKILIEKKPENTKSPDLADSIMMLFAPRRPPLSIHPGLLGT